MVGYWVSFALLFPIILFGVPYTKIFFLNNTKIKITPEMDKKINVKIVIYILFYWLCDLFYMACFKNYFICKYIFGGLIMLIIFMNLMKAFTNPSEKTTFISWGLLQDFLIGVGLSIYLIYIIPNQELKDIVIPIVAAIYGGLLTLVGVAWTIKKSDKDRKEEESKKVKPYLKNKKLISRENIKNISIPLNNQNGFEYIIELDLKNISNSILCITGFVVNNKYYHIEETEVLEGDSELQTHISYYCDKNEYVTIFKVIGHDIYDNYYEYAINSDNICEKCRRDNLYIQMPKAIDKPNEENYNDK